ncbi:MAG TPA: MarR family transcriptional regulator [Myxococcota bacterium]|nr:MarR family transcriptional regulator [Myxococcota bacterium]
MHRIAEAEKTIAGLGGCPCFSLRRAARRVSQVFDEELRPLGLRSTQFSVLFEVSRADGISRGELARSSGLDRTTLTRSLALLERDGLVAGEPVWDARERRVRLTPAGERRLARGLEAWKRARERVARAFGAGRLRALLSELEELELPEPEN